MKRPLSARALRDMSGGGSRAKRQEPLPVTDAMYRQDVAPFEEGFDVLARELAAALPGWGDRLAHPSPADRAGLLLRTMRNAAGLSQAKLGEMAGVKQSDISDLENGAGKQGPTFDVISRLADACGMYLTFAVKAPKAEARSARTERAAAAEDARVFRTYVMDESGALKEFEGTSPQLKKDGLVILDDSAGHTFQVKIASPRGKQDVRKLEIREAKPAIAAAVLRAQED